MRRIVIVAAAATLALTASRPARACGQGGGSYAGLAAIVMVVGLTDLGMSVFDLTSLAVQHKPSGAYGVIEGLVAVPQFAVAVSNASNPSFPAWYTLWMGLMSAHAIGTIAYNVMTADEPTAPRRVAFAPTYVPLGQQSKPAFGLVGRF